MGFGVWAAVFWTLPVAGFLILSHTLINQFIVPPFISLLLYTAKGVIFRIATAVYIMIEDAAELFHFYVT